MDSKQRLEKVAKCRGGIISDATRVEIALDWRLRLYFFPKSNHKAATFHDRILNSSQFSFDKKISLYESTNYFRRLKQHKRIKLSLRLIQRYRNALAHWEWSQWDKGRGEIILYSPDMSREVRLSKKHIAEFQEHVNFVLKTFGFKSYQSTWEF